MVSGAQSHRRAQSPVTRPLQNLRSRFGASRRQAWKPRPRVANVRDHVSAPIAEALRWRIDANSEAPKIGCTVRYGALEIAFKKFSGDLGAYF